MGRGGGEGKVAARVIIAPPWSTFSQRSSDLARIQRAWLAPTGVRGGMLVRKCWGNGLNNCQLPCPYPFPRSC